MERWIEKVAIVTGASAGIGYSIVEKLLDAGVTVVAVARNKDKLEAMKKSFSDRRGKFFTFSADVTIEQNILDLFKWVKENVGPVHILINNAGVIRKTDLCNGITQFWRDVFDTNVFGLCIATREAIQDMRTNKTVGHIVHINSVVGHKAVFFPHENVYPASKYAVTALTETLRNELNLHQEKIKITSISPGYVRTDILKTGFVASGETLSKNLEESLEKIPALNPEDVASAVMFALSTPPHVQIHELIIKAVGELA